MIFILVFIAIATIFYLLHFNYQYWQKRGVPGPKPKYFVGNLGPSFTFKKSPSQIFEKIYNTYQNASVVGAFRATTPILIIRDPEVIKDVTVKSFSSFHNNDIFIDKKVDPIFGKNPFVLRDDEWKTTRQQLTPGFSSGKMKWIYPLLEDISKRLVKFIENQPTAVNGKGYSGKELCTRFTLNNIGSCVFGLEAKCFEEDNPEFRDIAVKFLSPGTWQTLKIFLVSAFPPLSDFISIKFVTKEVEEKLTNIVLQTLKYREENNIVRNDFLHVLNQLKTTSKEEFTNVDITAHAAGFFVDGYETSSIVMSFLLYELAANCEAQTKLREELNRAFSENNGSLPYEVLQGLPYLDAVFHESLRLHPPLGTLQKRCTKSFVFTPKEGDMIKNSFTIEKGTPLMIPLYGLHRDSKYFDNPYEFKPERFLGANKENLIKYSYLPFGEGPRTCLGQRFGMMQVKIGVAYIVHNFKLFVNKKTKTPIEYDPTYFLTITKEGLWLDFKKIDK